MRRATRGGQVARDAPPGAGGAVESEPVNFGQYKIMHIKKNIQTENVCNVHFLHTHTLARSLVMQGSEAHQRPVL